MIAPNHLMQLVSYNHKDGYQTKHYVILKKYKSKGQNVKSTGYCGCNGKQENIDPSSNLVTESLFDEFEI